MGSRSSFGPQAMDQQTDHQNIEQMLQSWEETLVKLEADLRDVEEQRESLRARKASAEQMIDHLKRVRVTYMEFHAAISADRDRKTHFERVREYFESIDNRPQSMAELEAGTGIPRSSLSAVVYRTHREEFHMRAHIGKKPNTWQLKQAHGMEEGNEGLAVEVPF
jgi:septal ring factor EnvC (AmiA/AmiB activator)